MEKMAPGSEQRKEGTVKQRFDELMQISSQKHPSRFQYLLFFQSRKKMTDL